MGKKKALLAIGHKILCVIYLILKIRQPYKEFGVEQFERQRQQKRIAHLKQELKELGVAV
jgi:transposase